MIKAWRFTLFFLLCLTVALLFNLPVQQVLPHVQLPSNVQLAGVDGSVLKGRASEIREQCTDAVHRSLTLLAEIRAEYTQFPKV